MKAERNNNRLYEKFHDVEVVHTSNPYVDKFETLVETGLVTFNYAMLVKPDKKVRDHGCLFKLHKSSIGALFLEQSTYDLIAQQSHNVF